jgi:small subunit ribosomal protein S8
LKGFISNYEIENGILKIELGILNGCNAIKPRFMVKTKDLEKYTKRYLPSKNLGILIVSTSRGIMTHQTAQEKNIGGSLLAYWF